MGYDSHFTLTFAKKDKSYFSDEEVENLRKEIKDVSREDSDGTYHYHDKNGRPNVQLYFNERHWYDWGEDLAKVMKNHPGMSLLVIREGEDHDDTEKAFWKPGATEFEDCSDIVLEREVSEDDFATVAIIDSKDNSLSIVAVPAGVDPDEWLEDHFDGFDSNCTWQTVDRFRFYGQEVGL